MAKQPALGDPLFGTPMADAHIKSKQRVADHGEVFTPEWMVEAMLDLVKEETERIDSTFLEPACGSGNFLVPVLQRKLAIVQAKYGANEFEKHQFALLAVMSIYGIEILQDNIEECRANLLDTLKDFFDLDEDDELYRAASFVLSLNLIHGNALEMKAVDGQPIIIVEWAYLKGKFQRRDFRLDVLTQSAEWKPESDLFGHPGQHAIFTPITDYRRTTMRDLAAADLADVHREAV
jgi:hypothetical protein